MRVKTHDFAGQAEKAIPYGIYDIAANTGWVSIGTDHDTAAFAVASIRRWWEARGWHDYPRARRLLITADGGGSNGYRTRGWKTQLASLAAETGLALGFAVDGAALVAGRIDGLALVSHDVRVGRSQGSKQRLALGCSEGPGMPCAEV